MLDRLINYVQCIAEGFNYVLDTGLTKLANLKESIQSAFSSVAQYFSSSTSSTPFSTTPLTEEALDTATTTHGAAREALETSASRRPTNRTVEALRDRPVGGSKKAKENRMAAGLDLEARAPLGNFAFPPRRVTAPAPLVSSTARDPSASTDVLAMINLSYRIPRQLALPIPTSSNVLPVRSSFIGPMAPVLPITGSELTASASVASYALANRATLDLADITPAQYRKLVRMVLQNLSSITTPTTINAILPSGRSITVQITPVSERRAATNLEDIFASSEAARNPLTAILDGSVEGASAPRALTRGPFQEPIRIEPLHSASNAAVATETVAPQETVKPPFKFPEGFKLSWLDYPPLGFDTEKFTRDFIEYHAVKIPKGLKTSERYSYIRQNIKSAFLRAGS